MTPTGYMTEEAWVEMAQGMADGIRKVAVVKGMPHWWVLKIIDGFGPHTSSEKAMQIYADRCTHPTVIPPSRHPAITCRRCPLPVLLASPPVTYCC